ncbi:amino acid permease-domain-containing protein [Fimicolochytrium jonesii]|uniref:amino acid permease-domain-containing protein n=1 Tax=Fimicolochytrium jonesii TaxID=1396493 RepID=UPI0022FE0F66|nr:amino acid permease-domain-containing protein [Fimicolochytrium jonesii]KAI8824854.1 amino acid permease-domain-containing protein [Fimicolochytrium jonesii]
MDTSRMKFVSRGGTQLDIFSNALARRQSVSNPASNSASAQALGARVLEARNATAKKLSTFEGVFIPVFLSIWGVLAFLRLPWVVGQSGLVGTIGLFTLGYFLTGTTALSLSAISSNGQVGGGGPYYVISRCLGPEFGGSIGVLFYSGTVLGAVLNLLGFVEPLLASFGEEKGMLGKVLPEGVWWQLLYATCVGLLCVALCLVGSAVVGRLSVWLAIALLVSTFSAMGSLALRLPFGDPDSSVYFNGFNSVTLHANLFPHFTTDLGVQQSLRSVFSIVFPACTGILAGASMSGDLKTPSQSISKGTIRAMGFTYILYVVLALLIAGSIDRAVLRTDLNVLQDVSIVPALVAVGVAATCFFSALGSLLGAAKMLQAIIRDDLLPIPAKAREALSGGDEPVWAIFLTFGLIQAALFAVSDMNQIAPYVAMFSLLTFGVLNLACLLLRISGSPNFRPSFKTFSWRTAASGFAGCLVAMFVVDDIHAMYSCVLGGALFVVIHYSAPPKSWGDVTQSLIYHQVRKYLLRLDVRKDHVKFWRPQILVLVQDPRQDLLFIKFLNDMKKGGLFVLSHIIKGDFTTKLPDYKRQLPAWLRYIDIAHVKAFVQLTISQNERVGAQNLLLGGGLGGMKPNIIALGFLESNRRTPDSDEESLTGSHTGGAFTMYSRTSPAHNLAEQVEELNRDPLAADLPNSVDLDDGIAETDYVGIIEDALALDKAVAVARGFERLERGPEVRRKRMAQGRLTSYAVEEYKRFSIFLSNRFSQAFPDNVMFTSPNEASPLLPSNSSTTSSGSDSQTKEPPKPQYIDLWPMQLAQSGSGRGAYSFESYTMVLQLGTILHMVPHWRDSYKLRTVVFVEFEGDAEEERVRVAALLRGLRVDAEVHMVYLRPHTGPSSSPEYERICREISRNISPTDTSRRLSARLSSTRLSREYLSTFNVKDYDGDAESSRGVRSPPSRRQIPIFDSLPTRMQHIILNELLQHWSGHATTAVVLMTLPAPEPGTADNSERSTTYLQELDLLTKDLPPTLLVHGKGLTVTMEL